MGFQVSPGVEVKEIDLTNVIPAVSASIGGFAGYFKWGPVDQVSLISSEKGLIQLLELQTLLFSMLIRFSKRLHSFNMHLL